MSHLPSEALESMTQFVQDNPGIVREWAGVPSQEQLEAELQARVEQEQAQDAALEQLQQAINNIQLQPGPKGDKGDTGTTAAIAIGNITALPAGSAPTVTNSGTAQNAILNFGIPVGAVGAPGVNGTNGTNGASGTNATTTAVATTSTNGLMSNTDKVKLDKLGVTGITVGSGAVFVPLIGGASVDVPVTFVNALSNTSYTAMPTLTGTSSILGSLTTTVKSKTVTGCVITVKNNGLVALGVAATVEVVAYQTA